MLLSRFDADSGVFLSFFFFRKQEKLLPVIVWGAVTHV